MSFLAKAEKLLDVAKRNLGEDILYRHASGGSVSIKALWNNQYELIDPDTEALVSSNQPHVGVILKDLLEPPKQDDTLEFLEKVYKIVDIQEDGQGAAQLFLFKL